MQPASTMVSGMWAIIGALLLAAPISGKKDGAPSGACETLTPSHGVAPQSGPSPYRVHVNQAKYRPGSNIQVKIMKTSDSQPDFKGFIIQARDTDDNMVGRFVEVSSTGKLMTCTYERNTATHVSNVAKSEIYLQWRVPENLTQDIFFYATVVQSYNTFWAKLKSDVLSLSKDEPEMSSSCINAFMECLGDNAPFVRAGSQWEMDSFCRVKPQIISCAKEASLECQEDVKTKAKIEKSYGKERLSVIGTCAEDACGAKVSVCSGLPRERIDQTRMDWDGDSDCGNWVKLLSCIQEEPTCTGDWVDGDLLDKSESYLAEECPDEMNESPKDDSNGSPGDVVDNDDDDDDDDEDDRDPSDEKDVKIPSNDENETKDGKQNPGKQSAVSGAKPCS